MTLGPLGKLAQPVTVSITVAENTMEKRDILGLLLNEVRAVSAQLAANRLGIP
jgi:hypothetical protein